METQDRILHLYSQQIFQAKQEKLLREMSKFNALSEDERTEQQTWGENLQDEWNHLQRYPAQFTIPSNVQFVGTLNMDESTKNLSPKVLDRSYVIEISDTDLSEEKKDKNVFTDTSLKPTVWMPFEFDIEDFDTDLSEEEEDETLSTDTSLSEEEEDEDESKVWTRFDFESNRYPQETVDEVLQLLEELLRSIRDNMEHLSFSYSRRAKKQIQTLLAQGLEIDNILLGKIFPSMHLKHPDEKAIDTLSECLKDYQNCQNKLKKMYDSEIRELNYWRM